MGFFWKDKVIFMSKELMNGGGDIKEAFRRNMIRSQLIEVKTYSKRCT